MTKNSNLKRLTWLILAFFVALSTIFSGVSLFANEESQTNENISVQATGNVNIGITDFEIVTDKGYNITNYAAMLHDDNLIVSLKWTATSTNSTFQEGDSVSYAFLESDELAFLYATTQYKNLYDGNGTLVGKWRVVATTNGKTTGQIEMVFSASSSSTYSGTLKTDFDIKVNMPNTTGSIMGKAYIDTYYKNVLFCKNDYTTNELSVSKTVKNITREENHAGWAGDVLEYTISATNLTGNDLNDILFFDSLEMFSSPSASFNEVLKIYWHEDVDESVEIYLNGSLVVQGEYPKTMGGLEQRYGNYTVPANSTIEMKYKVYVKTIADTGLTMDQLTYYQRQMTNTAIVGGISTTANIDMQFPNLNSSKSVIDENNNNFAEADEKLTYTITSYNSGDATYEDMVIQDSLTGIYQYFVTPDTTPITVDIDGAKDSTTYTIRDLMDGNIKKDLKSKSTIIITFDVTMKDESTLESLGYKNVESLVNTASVAGIEVTASINANVLISVTKDAKKVCDSICEDEIIRPGDMVEYTITVKNDSNKNLDEIPVIDNMDNILQYFDIDASQQYDDGTHIYSSKEGSVAEYWRYLPAIWNGSFRIWISSGETKTLQYRLIAKETIGERNFDLNKLKNELNGKLSNTVIVYDKYEATASIEAGSPVISIDKSVLDTNGDDYASPEEKLYYKIVVRNDDSATLPDNTKIQDTLSNLLPYIEDSTNTVVEMKYTDKNGIVTTDNSKKVSDLIGGMSVYLEIGQEVELTFAVTLKDKNTISDGIELVNTANANKVSDSVTITTSSKEIPITGIEDDTNIWYLTIGIGVVMASLWLIYYLRKQRRYH
ncbi:isopeptide-forming domain-containing fimbrial protein [Breznakia pachnodae]|uniref:Repeat protein (TIGR01451 family) n=1 Tax=Breznakia pachnodae TaxID=265178 RepID=A0ABU0E5K0_9FIRM|nr:isopeptide-forming domain-containing fimbrial protein [Breznakia pachnodae]MDQ0362172.1 putative repeat protein (TIGR01451 family) [Breznakia pachnodae]